MRLLFFDFETTGLEAQTDRIIEVGALLKEVGVDKPLVLFSAFVWDESYPSISPKIEELTGITGEMLKEFGQAPNLVIDALLELMRKADYIVAHNGRGFDLDFLRAEIKRQNLQKEIPPILDTKTDLPFTKEPESRRLKHLAADIAKFLNPFEHAALFDSMTMEKVFSCFDVQEIIAFSKYPEIRVRAMVSLENKDLAKHNGFRWESKEKIWVRNVKEHKFEDEKKRCEAIGFQIVKL